MLRSATERVFLLRQLMSKLLSADHYVVKSSIMLTYLAFCVLL
jgi:hypothetical protein